jgi:NAD(P)-dependent dehydrogenase (short-subunit alcohol dehydrogenase family)
VGLVIAQELADQGWRVLLHARTQSDADATLTTLAGDGHQSFGADLSSLDELHSLGAWAIQQCGGALDLLINNASTFTKGQPEQTTAAMWGQAMNVNARAPLMLSSACLPALRAAEGTVINLGDRGPSEAWADRTAHAASKAALATISACCDKAWSPTVQVHHLELSLVLPPDNSPPSVMELRDAEGRGWSGAEAVAAEVLKIASGFADNQMK